jgi:uncharacterized membrane protein
MHMLYPHAPHPHKPNNANDLHKQEQQGINARIAVILTTLVGSMPTAYLFVILAIVGLLGITGVLSPVVALLVAWLSQTLIQLVLLPVIMVGQNVLNRKAEIQADEDFKINQKSFHDIEQVMQHLQAQDAELGKHTEALEKLMKMIARATNSEVA